MTQVKNHAVVMTGPGSLEVREVPFPEIGADDVILRIAYAGICGSDLHMFKEGCSGSYVVQPPFIQGHEAIGTVYRVGENVQGLKPGDKAILEPGIPCMQCEFCRAGRNNMCREMIFPSAPPNDGFFREYVKHPGILAHKVPDDTDMLAGVLSEPLSIALHGLRLGDAGIGKTVVILGAGCIGLLMMLACKKNNARRVIVSDVMQNRLDIAAELGADHIVNAAVADAVEEIRRLTDGAGAHVVYETAGSKATVAQCSYLVRRCGKIVLIGNVHGDVPFNFRNLAVNEAELIAMWRYCNDFRNIPSLLDKGWVDKRLITNVFDYTEAKEAFDYALNHREQSLKTVLKFQP